MKTMENLEINQQHRSFVSYRERLAQLRLQELSAARNQQRECWDCENYRPDYQQRTCLCPKCTYTI